MATLMSPATPSMDIRSSGTATPPPMPPVAGLGGPGDQDMKQRYCLKWNNYQSSVTTTFKELLAVEDFVDITLSAEGGALRAHKVVLSACSPYFRDILKGISAWQHPVIVLKDVPYEDLQGIVEFIYHGEVSVDKECLTSFLKTAQMLRVKGLTEETTLNKSSTSTASNLSSGRSHSRKNSKPKRSLPFATPELVKKKPHLDEVIPKVIQDEEEIDDVEEEEQQAPTSNFNNYEDDEEEIHDDEEEEEEEEEEVHPGTILDRSLPNPFLGLSPQSITNAALALANVANTTLTGGSKSSSVELDIEERKQRQQLLMGGAGDLIDPELFASGFGYPPPLKNMLNNMNGSNLANHIGGNNPADPLSNSQTPSSSGGSLSQKKTCPYCYQQLSWHALSRHIRDMHKAKTNFVTCKHCQKMFRNKNSLGCHMWRFHKEAKDKDSNNKDSGAMETNLKVLDHESVVKDNSNAGPLLE